MNRPAADLDPDRCYLGIFTGGSGAERRAWAARLFHQYRRFAERRGFAFRPLHPAQVDGDLAEGFAELRGPDCAALLAGETGLHRLTRAVPGSAASRRSSTMAMVECFPAIADSAPADGLDPADLQRQVLGPQCGVDLAGQVGPTAPLRLTHRPTGIAVTCSVGAAQAIESDAHRLLAARVRAAAPAGDPAHPGVATGFDPYHGRPIRKYVLDPFESVTDPRTGAHCTSATAVLDGDLDTLIAAYRHWRKADH